MIQLNFILLDTKNKIISCLLKMLFALILFNKVSCFFFPIFLHLNIKPGMFVNETTSWKQIKNGWNAIIIMIHAHYHWFYKNSSWGAWLPWRKNFCAICIFAVNITRILRQSYKIGECAAKYRLSFTKIKYSEQQEREENPLVESNFIVSIIWRVPSLFRRSSVVSTWYNCF